MVNAFTGNPYNGNEEDDDDLMDSFGDIVDLPIIVDGNQDLFETSSLIESDDDQSVSGHGGNIFGAAGLIEIIDDETDFDDEDYMPDSFSDDDDDDDDDDEEAGIPISYFPNLNNPREANNAANGDGDGEGDSGGDSADYLWQLGQQAGQEGAMHSTNVEDEGEHSQVDDALDNV